MPAFIIVLHAHLVDKSSSKPEEEKEPLEIIHGDFRDLKAAKVSAKEKLNELFPRGLWEKRRYKVAPNTGTATTPKNKAPKAMTANQLMQTKTSESFDREQVRILLQEWWNKSKPPIP